jgi:hypothetical protein
MRQLLIVLSIALGMLVITGPALYAQNTASSKQEPTSLKKANPEAKADTVAIKNTPSWEKSRNPDAPIDVEKDQPPQNGSEPKVAIPNERKTSATPPNE